MYNLKIITASVREGRKGPIVTKWISEKAVQHGGFDVKVLDLAEINLPMMNEPYHPAQRKYQFDYTKKWSAEIDGADAFVFVTAEYDFNYPAPLRNAIEFLFHEWNYKAAGIVSYGGVSAGTRAANSLKSDLSSMKMVPLFESVHLPFFTQFINEQGVLAPNEIANKAADNMLRELVRWTKGLQLIRNDK